MYQVLFTAGTYHLVKKGMPVHTPAGSPVITDSQALANKLLEHFDAFGPSHEEWRSIAHFHFPLLDFVTHYPREDVILRLILDLDPFNDWTLLQAPAGSQREKHRIDLFGETSTQLELGREWLESLNEYQLCAAMVLGRDLQSINAAYLAANCKDRAAKTRLISGLAAFKPELGKHPLGELLENYLFYRGL